jgi:hypothetical protein
VQRLYEESERMPHLTPQDRAICACIVKEQPPRFYGAYAPGLRLDIDRALLAAVGHPRLIGDAANAKPLELVRAGPTLNVASAAATSW